MKTSPLNYYREQAQLWDAETIELAPSPEADVCATLAREARDLDDQLQTIATVFHSVGFGLQLKSSSGLYCVILPDASEPGRIRYQTFNETGFIGHSTFDTVDDVLVDAFRCGFRTVAAGDPLSEVSQLASFKRGNLVNDLVAQVNRGELSMNDANELYEQYVVA